MHSASLCSLASPYDNTIPIRFLVPIDRLKIPAQSRYDMDGRSQMQGGKNWILPKETNANRFFGDSHWLEIWKNQLCPSVGPNGGSVAMDSDVGDCCEHYEYLQQVIVSVSDPPPPPSYGEHSAPTPPAPNNNHSLLPSGQNFGRLMQKRTEYILRRTNRRPNFWRTLLEKTNFSFLCVSFTCISFNSFQVF
jgi:hypothetical protein